MPNYTPVDPECDGEMWAEDVDASGAQARIGAGWHRIGRDVPARRVQAHVTIEVYDSPDGRQTVADALERAAQWFRTGGPPAER